MNEKSILVTGGAGFIGSCLVRRLINDTDYKILNLDNLTYAGNLASVESVSENERYNFTKIDINDHKKVDEIVSAFKPNFIINLAAESHVDRSIDGPDVFIKSNISGTFNLLEASRKYWSALPNDKKQLFKFHHVSTDEVYGDLPVPKNDNEALFFTEDSNYRPSSPYSASKAASDHLVRAWHKTFNLPTVITNCSNNYGPYHFPEKLIPLTILNALECKDIPIYGSGINIRDWLYVEDHVDALLLVLLSGKVGESYNIGGSCEKTNLAVVETICDELEKIHPINKNRFKKSHISTYKDLIKLVNDRPGHDLRYAIDSSKIKKELNWHAKTKFDDGIRNTIKWYIANIAWCEKVTKNKYNRQRLGKLFKSEVN
tara:strand:+ start:1018 stop:2136 length:1119 start_codon:yes stop_codon:yes gene_type:complete